MIRNHGHIVVTIITVIGLILVPAMYFLGSSSLKATSSREDQTSSATPSILPSVQYGNTQNHFVIDKSQFKKAPEFIGVTGFVNTPAPIKLADLRGKVVLVHLDIHMH